MTSSSGRKRTHENKRHRHKKTAVAKRTSSRTSRVGEASKDFSARVDDTCRIVNIKQTSCPFATFARCVPLSVNCLLKDMIEHEAMLGDTCTEKLYNALTINDRLVYAIAALLITMIVLLTFKLVFSRRTELPQEYLPWESQQEYLPWKSQRYGTIR